MILVGSDSVSKARACNVTAPHSELSTGYAVYWGHVGEMEKKKEATI